jgi:mannosyltransferase
MPLFTDSSAKTKAQYSVKAAGRSQYHALTSGRMLAIFGLLALGLVLRIPGLGESLWYDELWSTKLLLMPTFRLLRTIGGDVHPPFYTVLMRLWTAVFGDSELSIRFPPLLLGLASIPLVYLSGTRLVGKAAALAAAFFITVSPVHIWYSQEARPYSAVMFFLLLGVYSYYRLEESGTRRWIYVYALAMFGATFSHYYVAAFLLIISGAALRRKALQMRPILAINAALLFLMFGFLVTKAVVMGLKTSLSYSRPFTPAEFWTSFSNWIPMGNTIWSRRNTGPADFFRDPLRAAVQLGLVCAAAVGLIRAMKRSGRGLDLLLYVLALPLGLITIGVLTGSGTYIERSLFILVPFYLMTLGSFVCGWRRAWISPIVFAAFVVLSTASLTKLYSRTTEWTVYKPNEDWRSAAQYLSGELERSTRLLVFAGSRAEILTYYDDRIREVRPTPPAKAATPGQEKLGLARGVWGDALRAHAIERTIQYEQSMRSRLDKTAEIVYAGENAGGEICARAASSSLGEIYVILDLYWRGNFDAAFGRLNEDPRFRLIKTIRYKGLEIHRYSVATSLCGPVAAQ